MLLSRCLLILFFGFLASAGFAAEPKSASELGKAIEDGFKKRDLTILERSIDVEALLDRCLYNLPGTDKEKRDFRAGFGQGFSIQSGLRKAIEAAGDYKFLRVRKMGTNETLLFRLVTQDGTLN